MESKSRDENGKDKDVFTDHGGQSWMRAKSRGILIDKDLYRRADLIDLKSLDTQLEKRLSEVWLNDLVASYRPKEVWEIDPSKLRLRYNVARGTYGNVYRGCYDEQDVAVKILECSEEGLPTIANTATVRVAFEQEVSVWHMLDHPNVTKFVGASMGVPDLKIPQKSLSSDEGATLSSKACMVIVEYLSGGTLKKYLYKNHTKKLAFNIVIRLALDLARGLSYLHSKKIVHRDVKTENMLLDANQNLKIADFGVARVEAQDLKEMTGETGTFVYMAPEVLSRNPYDRKCDVYSFGICLWEMYCCDIPFSDLSFSELSTAVVHQNYRPKIPRCCPSALENIIRRCWDADPEKRPDMNEVVRLLEAIDTSKGGGMIPEGQMNFCFCLRRTRGP